MPEGEKLDEALEELRELARGLHPSTISKGGFAPVLRTLAWRSAIPMTLHIHIEARYPAPAELTAFYVVSEALTNTIKYANASQIAVLAHERDSGLVRIRDDGVGGANPRNEWGLIGLRDRVEAIGGSMQTTSPVGGGTTIQILLPIDQIDREDRLGAGRLPLRRSPASIRGYAADLSRMCTPHAEPRPMTWACPILAFAIWRSPASPRR